MADKNKTGKRIDEPKEALQASTTYTIMIPDTLTDTDRERAIDQLTKELRRLTAMPRSDWHVAMHALLSLDLQKYYQDAIIDPEVLMGMAAPRADFVVVTLTTQCYTSVIFSHFRWYNLIEYKNPDDALNETVIVRMAGLGYLFYAASKQKQIAYNHVQLDQITLTIIRSHRPKALFRRMLKNESLKKTETPGIYHVVGYTLIPFQIVITDELEGPEYAAYRAMGKNPSEKDVREFLAQGRSAQTAEDKAKYQTVMELITAKNRELVEHIRRNEAMADTLEKMLGMDVLKNENKELHDQVETLTQESLTQKEKIEVQKEKLEAHKQIFSAMINKLNMTKESMFELLGVSNEQRLAYEDLFVTQ